MEARINKTTIDRAKVVAVLGILVLRGLNAPDLSAQVSHATIVGMVIDVETRAPLGWTEIVYVESERSVVADVSGRFVLDRVAQGRVTLSAMRLGYAGLSRSFEMPAGTDTLRVTLELSVSPLMADGVVVEGSRVDAGDAHRASLSMSGRVLRRNLGTTVAKTLNEEPGVSMRSMGPAPARPVLRGMGGERLPVLEDGGRTGDLSATSSDHAVVIDPMTASRIEVIRGPASLKYSSSGIGGVVNVVRGYVPTERPDRLRITAASQIESVNRGASTGLSFEAPLGPLSVRIDGSARGTGDIETPEGHLKNTSIETYNPSIGLSLIQSGTTLGASFGYYYTDYGIPGGFVGAHPSGVNVTIRRRHLELRAAREMNSRRIPRLEARATYSWYLHREFESSGNLGVEFGVIAYHGRIVARTANIGPFSSGSIGIWGEYRDYASNGLVFTPTAREGTLAAFVYQAAEIAALTFQIGARYDIRSITPEREEQASIGFIRRRGFDGFSASAGAILSITPSLASGVSVIRSLRMPSLEELFSEGPHLAAYSYEVGDPELAAERGWGFEWFFQAEGTSASARVNLFLNRLTNYIFPRNTGELNIRLLIPTFQTSGESVRLLGGEFQGDLRLTRAVSMNASAGYVRGTLTEIDEPLPWIPPVNGKIGIRFKSRSLELSARVRASSSQKRLGLFEEATDSYAVLDLSASTYFSSGRVLHSFDFGIENVTDAVYRDHLSRVKSIMPKPGRNVRLLYKLYY